MKETTVQTVNFQTSSGQSMIHGGMECKFRSVQAVPRTDYSLCLLCQLECQISWYAGEHEREEKQSKQGGKRCNGIRIESFWGVK